MEKMEIIGNATRDAELRVTQAGKQVCSFTVAVNGRKKKDGTQDTKFFKVTGWDKTAETLGKYVKKGMKIYVCGTIEGNAYTTQNGETRVDLVIKANDFEFLSKTEHATHAEPTHEEPSTPTDFTDVTDQFNGEELPF